MERTLERLAKFRNLSEAYLSSYRHGTPAFIRVLPTDRCNLKCAYCWQHNNASADMTIDSFRAYLKKAKELHVGLITFLGGEPMIWSPLCEALALCTERHVMTDLTTNGTLLTSATVEELGRSGLDYLNISVDGTTANEVTCKNSIFRSDLMGALKEARTKHHMHTRINSVIYNNNYEAIQTLMEFSRKWDMQLSLWFIVPPLDPAQRPDKDIYFSVADEPLLRDIVSDILEKKQAGYPIIDPDSYFENIFRFIRREKFWDCNYPTRYGWINVTPTGRIRSCTKKMDELDFRFLDLDLESLGRLRSILKEKVRTCNIDCYSNCAYDSYFYTHNKGELIKKVLRRLKVT
ncbi:MAG: radical SAM protein [Geobacteraceae bacterium]|nr:radical SAM protein [Geobacteraceae bacterium]